MYQVCESYLQTGRLEPMSGWISLRLCENKKKNVFIRSSRQEVNEKPQLPRNEIRLSFHFGWFLQAKNLFF